MIDEADKAGRVRQAVTAALILFVLLLAGCKSGSQRGSQSESFLRSDDKSVLYIHWTRGERQIRGTIDILERKPGGEIGKTKLCFDGNSDGMNVRMDMISSWTLHEGDLTKGHEGLTGKFRGLLMGVTLTLFNVNVSEPVLFRVDVSGPVQFRRATHAEYEEAARQLEMRAKLSKGAY
jgi:hypothetical protein